MTRAKKELKKKNRAKTTNLTTKIHSGILDKEGESKDSEDKLLQKIKLMGGISKLVDDTAQKKLRAKNKRHEEDKIEDEEEEDDEYKFKLDYNLNSIKMKYLYPFNRSKAENRILLYLIILTFD